MERRLRDRLEPRDWRRPWRDPPGFLFPTCCTCGAAPCDCYAGVPLNLTLTLSSPCAAHNGKSCTMTRVPADNFWSGSIGSAQFHCPTGFGSFFVAYNFILTCDGLCGATGVYGCENFRLQWSVTDALGNSFPNIGAHCLDSCSCSPFSVHFPLVTNTGWTDALNMCGCGSGVQELEVTIVE